MGRVGQLTRGFKVLLWHGARGGGRFLHLASWCALGVGGLALALLFALLVRLDAPTPLPVTELARRALAAVGDPAHLRVEALTLRWSVLRDGPSAPLVVGWRTLRFAAGPSDGRIEAGSVGLGWAPLLVGRIEPVAIAVAGATVHVRAGSGGEGGDGGEGDGLRRLGTLRHVALRDVQVTVTGATPIGATITAARFDRDTAGALRGSGAMRLALAGQHASATIVASPLPDGATALRLAVAGFRPQAAPLAASVAMSADATVDRDAALLDAGFLATVGPGAVTVAGKTIPIEGGTVHVSLRPAGGGAPAGRALHLALDTLSLRLGAPRGGPGPLVTGSGSLDGVPEPDGALQGGVRIALDQVPAADLGFYWPASVAKGARAWITANIPTGTVSGLALAVDLAGHDGLASVAVAGVSGGFDARDLAVHWLRPIAPMEGVAGRIAVPDADTVEISVAAGHQGAIDVAGSRMRITGISAPDQIGRIAVRVHGPLPAVLGVLREKRLALLSRRPLGFTDPSGTIDGRVVVTLPLDAKVDMDQIGVDADVSLARVHLGNIAAGRSLSDGAFRLHANPDGLALDGTATVATLPTTIALGMDFRAGAPSDVVEHAHVTSTVATAALARAGLPIGHLADGTAVLDGTYALRRDKRADVTLGADLADAALTTPVGWSKEAGQPASIHAALVLVDGRLAAIDRLEASGPDLAVETHAIVADGTVRGFALDHVRVGATEATGRILFPRRAADPLAVTLRGAVLDLVPVLHRDERPPPSAAHGAQGSTASTLPWAVSLDFGRVLLPDKRVLEGVVARVRGAGARPVEGRVTAGAPSPVAITIAPVAGGRTLSIRADDAGAVLAGLLVTDNIAGGQLVLDGRFDDAAPGDPFSGHVTVDRFMLRRVPWVARLMRDATIYGLLDRAPSPGLAVTRLDARLRISDEALTFSDARVWQPALGLTATGTVGLRSGALDLHGTIVPAYAFNAAPGTLPVVGKLFSPEKGGGVFAATWSVRGPAAHPVVSVNPLAALVPGVLRKLLTP